MTCDTRSADAAPLQSLLEGAFDSPEWGDARIRWTDGAGGPPKADPPSARLSRKEELLVQGACLGDDGALEALCRKEWYSVYYLVSGSVPAAEAEEVTQEVFARAIASLSRFRYVGVPFRSYLAQIARNLLRDRWRAAQAQPDLVTEEEIPDWPAPGPEPEAIVLAADERHVLVSALMRLPSRCQEVLYLRLLEGRTAAEIGVDWGRTPEAVRQIQHRALLALRAEMGAELAGGGTTR